MTHDEVEDPKHGSIAVYGQAAALYVALIKAGHLDEATEFAEWFLETFDIDLEE